MAKGKKTGGRKPGSPNKMTAGAKEALEAVFEQRGGVPAFLAWSHRNPDEFYKLWGKLIPRPTEVEHSGTITHRHQVWKLGDREVSF